MRRRRNSQLQGVQGSTGRLRHIRLERLGGGSEKERPIDIAYRQDNRPVGIDSAHGAVMTGLDETGPNLFNEEAQLPTGASSCWLR